MLYIFFIRDVKDTTNFTIGLQIVMLLITKKLYKIINIH